MTTLDRRDYFPRAPLLGMFALVGVGLCAAITGRLTGGEVLHGAANAVLERNLTFADRADGAVVVRDVGTGRTVEVMTGQQGFVRGVLRGMARTRHSLDVGASVPFTLTAWSDNRLTLNDPATGRDIEIESFGPDNEAVFARLLTEPESTP